MSNKVKGLQTMSYRAKDTVSIKTSQSFHSFGPHIYTFGRTVHHETCSQPFGKPSLAILKKDFCAQGEKKGKHVFKVLKKFIQRSLHSSTSSKLHCVESVDECKTIIRDLAAHLSRVTENGEGLHTSSVAENYSLAECQFFILQWALELNRLPKFSGPVVLCESWEQYEEVEHKHPEEAEKRLKAAQKVLSTWAAELEAKPQGSVCPGKDVKCVLEELGRKWKRGQLPNMLPALDFIMWSVLQDLPLKGSIPKQWMKSKQRFRSQGAVGHIPDIVWDMFQQSSVNINLDLETAHPDFVFSGDGKEIRLEHIVARVWDPRQDSFRNPHQFDGWWCVQGTQGFSSGRAYWEVGVTGKKDWRLGVVKETAQRKGFMDLNTQSGYWTLRLQRDKLRALSVPAKDLPLPHPLSRVGIYLDMEEDQLSFYDAERRSHIYTFNHSFPQRVFPIFGTIETDTELTVL